MGKLITFNEIQSALSPHKKKGHIIVSTNGCFDLIHPGHIDYLNKAKDLGDILIIGLNSDKSVQSIKGPTRPITPQTSRSIILLHLIMVDFVCLFDDPTPLTFLQHVAPHIHVKGGDYKKKDLPETPIVEKSGGQIHILPFLEGYSSSSLISKIKQN